MSEIISFHDQPGGSHVNLVENQRNQHHNNQQTRTKIFQSIKWKIFQSMNHLFYIFSVQIKVMRQGNHGRILQRYHQSLLSEISLVLKHHIENLSDQKYSKSQRLRNIFHCVSFPSSLSSSE